MSSASDYKFQINDLIENDKEQFQWGAGEAMDGPFWFLKHFDKTIEKLTCFELSQSEWKRINDIYSVPSPEMVSEEEREFLLSEVKKIVRENKMLPLKERIPYNYNTPVTQVMELMSRMGFFS